MALEIARRLVGGRWSTGPAEEAGGGGGGSPVLHGAFVYLNLSGQMVDDSGVDWDHAAYDTDGYLVAGELTIPSDLGGVYLVEAAVYVAPAGDTNPGLDHPVAIIAHPSDSCDIQFNRKNPDSNAPFDPSWWYGSGSFVRPFAVGDPVPLKVFGSTSNPSSEVFVYGGTSQTMMTLTKLFDLPDGYVSPF